MDEFTTVGVPYQPSVTHAVTQSAHSSGKLEPYIALDEQLHEIFHAFENHEILWRDFKDVGIDETYYDYYYAEGGPYIIRDRVMEEYFFVEARNPKEAFDSYMERHTDVASALDCMAED